MLKFDETSLNYLGPVGCLLDFVGAVLLARALAFVRPRDMEKQSTSGYGGFSGPLLRMFSEQKADAWFGLLFFLFGFTLQAMSGLGYKTSDFDLVNIVVVAASGLLAIYSLVRDCLTRRFFSRSLASLRDHDDKPRLPQATIDKLWEDTKYGTSLIVDLPQERARARHRRQRCGLPIHANRTPAPAASRHRAPRRLKAIQR